MNNERCFLIGIAPGSFEVTAVDCSSKEEYKNEDEHYRVLQLVVDGHIEHVDEPKELRGRCLCFVNEEGLLKELSYNTGASLLLRRDVVGRLCIVKGDAPETFFAEEEATALAGEIVAVIQERWNEAAKEYFGGKNK